MTPMDLRGGRADEAGEIAELWLRSRAASVPAIPPPVHADDEVRAWIEDVVLATKEVWVPPTSVTSGCRPTSPPLSSAGTGSAGCGERPQVALDSRPYARGDDPLTGRRPAARSRLADPGVTRTLAATPESPVLRRIGTLLAGLVLVGGGVAITIAAEIGVAPYDVLTTGLAELTGLEIGIAAMILPTGFVALGVGLGGKVGPGTLLAVLLVGPILGIVLHALPEVEALAPRIAMFGVGFVLVACGITAVVIAEIGPGPAEVLMLAIHDRGHELARTRTGIELSSVAIGWGMGGQVGFGTAFFAVAIGPTLRQLLRLAGYRAEEAHEAATAAEPGA